MAASSNAVRRLQRDLQRIESEGINPQLKVSPSNHSMLEWHFVLHNLPCDTAYASGRYHGKLIFPEAYPHAPPALFMLTPSGRFETNKRLCLSMTDFHPESWNPAWSIESILVGLISFMVDEADPKAVGALKEPAAKRKQLAKVSHAFNLTDAQFCELFPEFANEAAIPGGDEGEHTVEGAVSGAADAAPDASPDDPIKEDPTPAPVTDPAAANAEENADPEGGDAADPKGPPQCWICWDKDSAEPLIQPCACRGSMSGVHAGCVEAWIRRHRTSAAEDEVPHCSVCKQAYTGVERRPGPLAFVSHLCRDLLRQALRSTILVALLVAYWAASQPDVVSSWVRVVFFALSGSFFVYKALVLTLSLPAGREPPAGLAGRFFQADFRLLVVDVAEAIATVVIAGLWCVYGKLHYYYFLPLCLLLILPMGAMLVGNRTTPSWYRTLLWRILFLPRCILEMARQNPRRFVDPTDGVVHVIVPLAAIPLAWFCHSNMPVVLLWACHSVVLLLCFTERVAVKRLDWKPGRIWWLFLQLSVLAVYVGNLLSDFSEGFFQEEAPVSTEDEAQTMEVSWPEAHTILVVGVSMFWLCLSCLLSFLINRQLVISQYRAWQRRNGTFTLSGDHAGATGSSAPVPNTVGAADPEAPEAPRLEAPARAPEMARPAEVPAGA